MHSDVTRPGGWPIFEKWYFSEHTIFLKNGIFQNINFNYLSVSEMSKATKDILLSVKRQSVFRIYDSKVRCS